MTGLIGRPITLLEARDIALSGLLKAEHERAAAAQAHYRTYLTDLEVRAAALNACCREARELRRRIMRDQRRAGQELGAWATCAAIVFGVAVIALIGAMR